ncbi:MAG: hypothetical protein HFI72_06660 [Peptococcaceae bacterium]|nr:hypothetical protein [Peptococcaceae bacterium]
MVPPIPQAAWAAPSSTGTLAGSFAPQSNKIYNLANGGDYSLQSADISNTTFVLSSGSATLRVPANQTVKINDAGSGCSPISLLGNANLRLVVDGTLEVTGGKAGNGANGTGDTPAGGEKGYAGISVPVGTTLTVAGTGTVIARGGHAGDGGDGLAHDCGGAGGGGAGAGIGGDGGKGGGGTGAAESRSGAPGSAGVSAGTINLYERVKVTAYGGAGGSGGYYSVSGPGGGGGYPAAGIGGGGAGAGGGNIAHGGGGFSGGRGEADPSTAKNTDGVGAPAAVYGPGGGYFSAFNGTNGTAEIQPALGGGAIKFTAASFGGGRAGNGGAAGSGGTVRRAEATTLALANGSYKTANKAWGSNPTPIYAQSGYDLDLIRKAKVTKVDAGLTTKGVRSKAALESELGATGKSSSIKATALAGVGSGAGYLESSNGSFTIQKVPERVG